MSMYHYFHSEWRYWGILGRLERRQVFQRLYNPTTLLSQAYIPPVPELPKEVVPPSEGGTGGGGPNGGGVTRL